MTNEAKTPKLENNATIESSTEVIKELKNLLSQNVKIFSYLMKHPHFFMELQLVTNEVNIRLLDKVDLDKVDEETSQNLESKRFF